MSVDGSLFPAYTGPMDTQTEFNVTEAAMQAVLETMTNMAHAYIDLSRALDETHGALAVVEARLALVEAQL